MRTILCSGMERSASTLTWQIVQCLTPETRPLGWEPGSEVKGWTGHPADWPIKRHDYMGGERPVVYTYRHPIEAFLSLRRCFLTDYDNEEASKHALRLIIGSKDVHDAYKADQAAGRPVLFLKYEEYYEQPAQRIQDVALFMLIIPALRDNELQPILELTNIKKNAERIGKSFHQDHYMGMQGKYINTETWGNPGKLLQKYAKFVSQVKHDVELVPLRNMCKDLGYSL